MTTRTKIWLGVGAAVFASTTAVGAGPTITTESHPLVRPANDLRASTAPGVLLARNGGESGERGEGDERARKAKRGQGGESGEKGKAKKSGGEGGEGESGEAGEGGAAASLPPDVGFAFMIAQMRGHLSIAEELLQAGNRGAALTHFQHPAQEVYGKLRPKLKEYGVAPFDAALKGLVASVREKKDEAGYAAARKTVDDALAAAEDAVRTKQKDGVAFTAETAFELIKHSAEEYEEAVKKGRIVNPVEYQDGRGFAWQAERMIESVASDLEKKDAAALGKVRAALAELKKAWPSPTPPKTPVKDYSAVLSDVARIELAIGPLLR